MSRRKPAPRRIIENSQIDKSTVAWAAGTLAMLGVNFEAVPESRNSWDIETRDGWIAVSSVAELAAVARAELDRRERQKGGAL